MNMGSVCFYFIGHKKWGVILDSYFLILLLGVPQDFKKAIEYYKRAVEKKYVESMYHLALMYIYGRSGTIEYAQALTLLEAGA